jgi:hypothetical protein
MERMNQPGRCQAPEPALPPPRNRLPRGLVGMKLRGPDTLSAARIFTYARETICIRAAAEAGIGCACCGMPEAMP